MYTKILFTLCLILSLPSLAADSTPPSAIGHESTGLQLKGGVVRQAPSGVQPTTDYPSTYRYLSEAVVAKPVETQIVDDPSKHPTTIEFLPQTFFSPKTSLGSYLLRLTLLLMVMCSLIYGGFRLWVKK